MKELLDILLVITMETVWEDREKKFGTMIKLGNMITELAGQESDNEDLERERSLDNE